MQINWDVSKMRPIKKVISMIDC